MSNKFLGINSINVLKDYIDKQISLNDEKTSIVTIHAYKYAKDGNIPATPKSGSFDQNGSNMIYPEGWSSLQSVVDELGGKEVISDEINYEKLEKALQEGSIWLSVGVAIGSNILASDTWSTPIKISGQNGVSVKFAYSYDKNATEDQWTEIPSGVNQENRIEYVWTKYADESWSGPTIWSMYSVDASMIIWKYCLSTSINDDNTPINPTPWYKDIPLASISPEYPYMWMSYKIIPSPTKEDIEGEKEYLNDDTTYGWSQPVLFGHYGQDAPVIGTKLEEDGVNYWTTTLYDKTDWLLDENGEKLRVTGRDGNAPNYNITLYKYSTGYSRPDTPTLGEYNKETGQYEFADLESFRTNNPDWVDVPSLDLLEEPEIDTENIIEVGSIEDLTSNLVDGKTLKLTEDLVDVLPIILTEGNVVIDLNGHNITAKTFTESSGNVIDDGGYSDSYVFWVKGGHLTIQGNGTVKAIDADYSMAVWSNGGDVTIKGGYYENGGQSCTLIYGSARKTEDGTRIGGTITIYDGEFKATLIGEQAGTGDKRTALNTKNSDEDICKIVVYGGYFHEFDPSNNHAITGSDKKSFLGDGVVVTQNVNGVFEVVDKLNVEIWWQCTVLIDGVKSEVIKIGSVERYTAIDGTAKPGQYTINLYAWSSDQNQPEMSDTLINGWRPANYNYLPDKPFDDNGVIYPEFMTDDASLWMITGNVVGVDINGIPVINGAWSEPVKLTGPRGPIAYDYRIETRYEIGTENSPKSLPTEEEWSKDAPETTTKYPYIWAATYLVVYKMKYDKDDKIVTADNGTLLESYEPFRLSGINGEDGNKKNSIKYTNSETAETIKVTSFSENNLYISNSNTDVTYEIELDKLSFINGYTGKFANIGSGKILIKVGEGLIFSGSNVYAHLIELEPQETIELVCYNNGSSKELLVIGKVLLEN